MGLLPIFPRYSLDGARSPEFREVVLKYINRFGEVLGLETMPRLNTSNAVKERIERLLAMLLAYANNELSEGYDALRDQLTVRWLEEERDRPRLIVKTELRFLAELVFDRQSPQLKATLKQDLQVLDKFLEILEDNRTKTKGSAVWHFTLTLWHRSAERNLREFRREWERRKAKSKPPASQPLDEIGFFPHVASAPGAAPAENTASAVAPRPDAHRNPSPTLPYSNLPARDYATFVGRQQQLAQMLELLSFESSVARISVEGIGGVGKTSLVLEAAHRCLQSGQNAGETPTAPAFDAIIFMSAKPQHFTPRGILPRFQRERTLGHVFRAIARALNLPGMLAGNFDDRLDAVRACLSRQRALLIVDNLETLEEREYILSFLYDLPSAVKAIITSRDRTLLDVSIQLVPLNEVESLRFIERQTQLKAVRLDDNSAQTLYRGTGGMPAAMVYAIGQLANGYPLQTVLPRLTEASGDFCRFHFEGALQSLRGRPAHHLLMALVLFPEPALKEAVVRIARPDAHASDPADDFARLHQLSLIAFQGDRCHMLPLTREYMLAELADRPEFERAARERWLQWALQFATQHGDRDWRAWHDYDRLDREWGNLQAALEWCLTQERYDAFGRLWPFLRGYTYLYGYWNERLAWMGAWLQAAQQQADPQTIAQALRDKAWTLVMMGKSDGLAEADDLLEQAWAQGDGLDRADRLELAIERGLLYSFQDRLAIAHTWFDRAKVLLAAAGLGAEQHLRQSIRIDYYEAGVWFRQGEGDGARSLYQQVLENARAARWQQVEVYTLNWLADIALERGQLDDAERLLASSFPLALQSGDKRSIAFHKRSWAQLEKLRGNQAEFQRWAAEAKTCFKQLGMQSEVDEMQNRLNT